MMEREEALHIEEQMYGPIRDQLDIGYRVLAVAALVWCIWSWQTEHRFAAAACTVFAGLALFCAVFVII